MRILGLDPGERRVGVAVSDGSATTAHPRDTLDPRARDFDERLRAIVAEIEAGLIVVGLPVSLDGGEGPAAERARGFAARVAAVTGVEVALHDERFTTVTAERVLLEAGVRRTGRVAARDRVAAAVMLQSYLDGRARTGES